MDFNGRNPNGCDGVSQGTTRVRVSSRVQNNHVESVSCFLNPTDQFAFEVALSKLGCGSQLGRPFARPGLDLGQCGSPVNSRLALTEHVQVGPVQAQYLHACAPAYFVHLWLSISFPLPNSQPKKRKAGQAMAGM